MCGIVGYTATEDCVAFLMSGLECLEYRGYDSAGVAVADNASGKIEIRKTKGRLGNLRQKLETEPVHGLFGIGHTRWATHGEPNYTNAHPHTDASGNIAIVHNGIIENFYDLKRMLIAKGVAFSTETDTEVVAQLLGYYYDGDMLSTLYRVLPLLEGTYGLAIIDSRTPGKVFCTRKGSPLVAGVGEKGAMLASDIPAMLRYTRDVYILDDLDIGVLDVNGIAFYDELGNPLKKETVHIDWDIEAAEKGGYPHFMMKEIFEQPKVLENTFKHYVDADKAAFRDWGFDMLDKAKGDIKHITVLACGTAYHAGMVGRILIEALAGIKTDVDIASEFRYRDTPIYKDELFVVVSQSGETLDTVAAMRRAKAAGCRVLALCNVIGSTVAREADAVMYTMAGPEIAVASTKAYSAQLELFVLLALKLAHENGRLEKPELERYFRELALLPWQAEKVLESTPDIQHFAAKQMAVKNVFFIGRCLDYCLALEAALKLKEISYLHAEAYAAGELKHGTIALIEDGSLVIAMATQQKVFDKMLSNIEEVRVRGARVLAVSQLDAEAAEGVCQVLKLPQADELLAPILAIIPMQLFAYYMALGRGCDIDKPRNLAKSVTVE